MAFTVTYREMYGYPRSGWADGEFDAERRIFCAWSDRVTYITELDAYPNCQYPYSDGPANALVRRVKINPFGKSTGSGSTAAYEWCIIQVWHSTRGPVWDTALGVFISEKVFPAFQYKMVDPSNLRWDDDSATVNDDDAPRLDDCLYEYLVTYSRLSALPAWVLTRPGICNSNVVTGKTVPLSWPIGTLKYNGCSINSTYSLGTTLKYDVTAKFLFKASGWNTFWRPDGGVGGAGGYEAMKTADGTTYVQHTPTAINL